MDASRLRGLQTSMPGRYAKALFEVALTQQQTDAVLTGLNFFYASMQVHNIRTSELLFLNADQFSELIADCVTKLKWPAYLGQFFKIIHQSRRINLLPSIIDVFESLNDHAQNRLSVMLSVAEMPDVSQRKQLEEKITQLFGKEMRYEYQAIPSLIGGFVANVQDTLQIDASVSTQISQLHKTLTDATLKGDNK